MAEERIDADGGFVEDEQLGLVEEGDGEGDAPLLAARQRLDGAVVGRQVQQFEEKLHLLLDEGVRQPVDAAKVFLHIIRPARRPISDTSRRQSTSNTTRHRGRAMGPVTWKKTCRK